MLGLVIEVQVMSVYVRFFQVTSVCMMLFQVITS